MTDAERAAAHEHARREMRAFEQLANPSPEAPVDVLRADIPHVVRGTKAPEPLPAAQFAPLRDHLVSRIPRWAAGERRAAALVARETVDNFDRQAQAAFSEATRAHEGQRAVVKERNLKYRRDLQAEQRLLEHVRRQREDGAGDVVEFLLARMADQFDGTVSYSVTDGAVELRCPAPQLSDVPEREPTHTKAGKPTTRALTKTERSEQFCDLVSRRVAAAAVHLGLAVPGSWQVTLTAPAPGGSYGHHALSGHALRAISRRQLAADYRRTIQRTGRTLDPIAT